MANKKDFAIQYKQKIYLSIFSAYDKNDKPIYLKPVELYAYVSQPQTSVSVYNIGIMKSYDRIISLDIGDNTEFLNEFSHLWINAIPNNRYDNFDYVVVRIGDIVNRTFKVYLQAVTTNNQNIYYSNDNYNIYSVKVIFDKSLLKAIIPKNLYLPINVNTKVWYKMPNDVNTTENKIVFVEKIDKGNAYFYMFRFA